jgi:Fe2+ or Zn2+ uptake regulation protein
LEGPLDADGFYNKVIDRGFNIRYKESVYKELQTLVQADLIDKYYDVQSKKILYRLKTNKVVVDIRTMETETISPSA